MVYNSTDNQYLVVWQGSDDAPPLVAGELEIWARRLDADGNLLGADQKRLSDMGGLGDADYAADYPDVAYNISKLTGFVSVQNYANQTATVSGEFGYYGGAGRGVLFVMSEDASILTGDGAPLSGADLRTTSSNTDV